MALLRHGVALGVIAVLLGGTAFGEWVRLGRGRGAPRIGISVSREWYDRLQINRAPYDLALARAGANVATIEPGDLARLDEILDSVDGLLLAGGGDVDPALYGGKPGGFLVDRARDDFEIELLRRAERRGLPVLGICRGIQLMAVAEGGRLRDLSEEPRLHARHGITLKSFTAHDVRVEPGSRAAAAVGAGVQPVSSFHRMSVADAGPRLRVTAVDEEGVIEAVELPGPRFVMAIQWHPELDSGALKPFELLVAAAWDKKGYLSCPTSIVNK